MADYRFFRGAGDDSTPCVYAIDMAQQPFDFDVAAKGLSCHVATLVVDDWDTQMSPWPAPGLYKGDADFKGGADGALELFLNERVPQIEREQGIVPTRRAIAGYSMGGLFSIWALLACDAFDAAASMSGSLWFPDWIDYAKTACLRPGAFAYLSLGTKEKRASPDILKTVEDNTLLTCDLLKRLGAEVTFQSFPGGHMDGVPQRIRAGLLALDAFLMKVGGTC